MLETMPVHNRLIFNATGFTIRSACFIDTILHRPVDYYNLRIFSDSHNRMYPFMPLVSSFTTFYQVQLNCQYSRTDTLEILASVTVLLGWLSALLARWHSVECWVDRLALQGRVCRA